MRITCFLIVFVLFVCACSPSKENEYRYLLNALKAKDVIELTSNEGRSRLIVSPWHQGKIIATTYDGLDANYNGWVNISAIEDSSKNIGGEERLWIGPLGSQFSFYFQQVTPLHDDNWKVPDVINKESYTVISKNKSSIELSKDMRLVNHIGTEFNFLVNRKINILSSNEIQENLHFKILESSNYVAFETKHLLTNLDSIAWTEEKGLVGLWSAGMYQGTDDTIVIIPLIKNGNSSNILTYLASIDSSRLYVKNNTLLFKADGKFRSKIGIPPEIAPNIYGCFSKTKQRLTIIQYKKENDSLYSNSFVDILDHPYKGEAIPIYNHSENFYELESNGALKALKPNEVTSHWQRIYHFSDSDDNLNQISKNVLGIDLTECTLR